MSGYRVIYGADVRLGLLVLACALVVYLGTAGGSLATTDAVATYDVTRQIVAAGTVALSGDLVGNEAYLGPDGLHYSPFGLLQSIWNIPFYLVGRAAATVLGPRGLPVESLTKATVALGNAVAAALCVWLIWRITILVTAGGVRVAVGAAAIAAYATPLWPYSKFGFNAPLSAVLVAASVYFSLKTAEDGRGRSASLAGAACAVALLTRHELALVALPSLALIGSAPGARRLRLWGSWAAGAMPATIVWLWYNHARFGSIWETGYFRDQTIGMGSSFAGGLWGLLCSPAASVFLYSPIALPALVALAWARRDHPRLTWTLVSLALIFTLFYAQMASWAGGRSYGPRYLVPIIPLLCVPVAMWLFSLPVVAKRWLVACCILSAAVQVPGVLVDFSKVRVAYARQFQNGTYEARMNTWEANPLALNTKASVRAVSTVVRHLTGMEPKPVVDRRAGAARGEFGQQLAFSIDFWWIYLFYLGAIPAWLSIGTGVVFLLSVVLLMAGIWRRTKGDTRG